MWETHEDEAGAGQADQADRDQSKPDLLTLLIAWLAGLRAAWLTRYQRATRKPLGEPEVHEAGIHRTAEVARSTLRPPEPGEVSISVDWSIDDDGTVQDICRREDDGSWVLEQRRRVMEICDKLGLEDPVEFFRRNRDLHGGRRTGLTTFMLIRALIAAVDGHDIVIVGASYYYSQRLKLMLRRMASDAGLVIQDSRIEVSTHQEIDRYMRGRRSTLVFSDHYRIRHHS